MFNHSDVTQDPSLAQTNAGSHLYVGFELLFMLVTLLQIQDQPMGAATWGTWMVAMSLLLSPFWFSPLSFSIGKVTQDWKQFKAFLADEVDPSIGVNWSTWNR